MIKKAMVLLMGIMLMVSIAAADETSRTIQSMTDLGEIQSKLDQGITLGKVYYTNGYGFSTSEFTTDDPDEIAQLWKAINSIQVGEKVNESITDWYPQIVFYLTDGTHGGVRFEANWLCIGGMENYEISNADNFWNLTACLIEKHEAMEEDAVPGGQSAAKVSPLPVDINSLDFSNGSFNVQIEDIDQIVHNHSLTFSLYLDDHYDSNQIKNLSPGDTILVAGAVYTVKDISIRDDCWFEDDPESLIYEIETEEENWEGIHFLQLSDEFFIANVGDWTPVTYVGHITIPLPLPASFVYFDYPGGEDSEIGTEEDLLADLQDSSPSFFNPYNTSIFLHNGELLELHNWSYPWGPQPEEDPEA